jgi:hypothetical protein
MLLHDIFYISFHFHMGMHHSVPPYLLHVQAEPFAEVDAARHHLEAVQRNQEPVLRHVAFSYFLACSVELE